MKVLLIYPNIAGTLQMPMGLGYISSVLKENGIEVYLWDGTFDSEEYLLSLVNAIGFSVICFSALSPDYEYVKDLSIRLRDHTDAFFVIGGYHATFCAEEVYNSGLFQVVIKGEAEYVLLEYIKGLGSDIAPVGILQGRLADINDLPWPDHDIFKRHFTKQLNWELDIHERTGVFLTSRGCPFKCTYCSAEAMSKLHKGNFTRYRDIDDLLNEIYFVVTKYQLDNIWFTDETFTVSKKHILKFCDQYKQRVGIPFSIETRPDTVNYEVLEALKHAGCTTIRMGIESGVDRIRNGIYNRNISRETILRAFLMAKEIGLKTSSFNICGTPTETIEDIRATIDLNVECRVDQAKMTLLSVFPGTKMWDWVIEHGYQIRDKYPENYYIDSNISHETLTIPQLIKLRHELKEKIK